MSRMLGITYKSTWFMCHRLREAMKAGNLPPLGGEGMVVEADETYLGNLPAHKAPVRKTPGRPKFGPQQARHRLAGGTRRTGPLVLCRDGQGGEGRRHRP